MKNTLKNFSKKAVSMPMVLLLIIIVGGGTYFWFRTDNGKAKITNETIGVQVKELKELATIQYKYKELAVEKIGIHYLILSYHLQNPVL